MYEFAHDFERPAKEKKEIFRQLLHKWMVKNGLQILKRMEYLQSWNQFIQIEKLKPKNLTRVQAVSYPGCMGIPRRRNSECIKLEVWIVFTHQSHFLYPQDSDSVKRQAKNTWRGMIYTVLDAENGNTMQRVPSYFFKNLDFRPSDNFWRI